MMNNEDKPLSHIHEWMERERQLGSKDPNRVILATASKTAIARCRVVAVREITSESILFFSQKGSRKVRDIAENPQAAMTFWFVQQQREVVLEGQVLTLSKAENELYWQTLSFDRQLRFSTYAPLSGQPIQSLAQLDQRQAELEVRFKSQTSLPMSDCYCGFRLMAERIYYYTLGDGSYSEVICYTKNDTVWQRTLISP